MVFRAAPVELQPRRVVDLEQVLVAEAEHRADGPDHPEIKGGVSRSFAEIDPVADPEEFDGEDTALIGPEMEVGRVHAIEPARVRSDLSLRIERGQIPPEDADEEFRHGRRFAKTGRTDPQARRGGVGPLMEVAPDSHRPLLHVRHLGPPSTSSLR